MKFSSPRVLATPNNLIDKRISARAKECLEQANRQSAIDKIEYDPQKLVVIGLNENLQRIKSAKDQKMGKRQLIFVVLSGVVFLTAPQSSNEAFSAALQVESSANRFGPLFDSGAVEKCSIAGLPESLLCGHIVVPENRHSGGRKIDIRFMIVPAEDSQSVKEPIFVLEGGPGAAVSKVAQMYALTFAPMRANHDLVLVDLRGTGKSAPLDCPADSETDPAGALFPLPQIETCRQAVSENQDPLQYSTAAAMADLDAIRALLGYDQIHLFGVSYGTRAALHYLREFPAHAKTATLLGPYPLNRNAPLEAASIADKSLQMLVEQCAEDDSCHLAFPDLQDELKELLIYLTKPEAEAANRHARFAASLRLMLFSPVISAQIPQMIHRAAAGDFGRFDQLGAMSAASLSGWISYGTLFSTLCSEDIARIDVEDVRVRAEKTFFGSGWTEELIGVCQIWGHKDIDPDFWRPVTTELPVLLLVGELDPSMPPSWALELAERMPNSKAIVIPQGHHSLIGMRNVGCILKLMGQFIDQASVKGLDPACVDTMARPPFATD